MGIDARNRGILEAALASKQAVMLSAHGVDIAFQTLIKAIEPEQVVLENRIKPHFVRAFVGAQQFSLQAAMVRFNADHIGSDGEHVLFPLKKDSVIEETRQAERFAFDADERVVAEVLNPFDGETTLAKSVMDMSATGLSLRTTYESKLFEPGVVLPSVRVMISGETYMQAAGRIVYRRKILDLSGQIRIQVGIKFES